MLKEKIIHTNKVIYKLDCYCDRATPLPYRPRSVPAELLAGRRVKYISPALAISATIYLFAALFRSAHAAAQARLHHLVLDYFLPRRSRGALK